MSESRIKRRLAAILAADVVSFGRMMEADEVGTLEALKARRREVLDPLIARHRGRMVKVMGDGVIVEFASAVDAVQCAIDLQQATVEANAPLPESRRIVLRVGINLGDVIVEGSDIYGDGVNVAARLEALCEPGHVCISGSVHDQVKRKLDIGFDDLGEKALKNIAEPVRIYRLASPGLPDSNPHAKTPVAAELPLRPSVAILPFNDMSPGGDHGYFADGMTEDIITELSRFKSLLVVARNSSFAFRGQSADLRDVGHQLGVKYLVEGSVRKSGPKLRITAQLIEAESGTHIWAERFDRDLAELLEVQDELVRTIVATIGGRIEMAGKARVKRLSDQELRAYDLYLRAAAAEDRNTREDYDQARTYLQQAVRDDPNLAQAYHHLSLVDFVCYMAFWVEDRPVAFANAISAAKQSLALDDSNSSLWAHYGMLLMYTDDYEDAASCFDRALAVNPNDAKAIALHGYFLTAVGRTDDALAAFDAAAGLDPFRPAWTNWLRGIALFTARRYRDAIASFKAVTSPMNEVRGWLVISHAHAGDIEQARVTLATFIAIAKTDMIDPPDFSISAWKPFWWGAMPYRDESDSEHLYEALRLAGMPD